MALVNMFVRNCWYVAAWSHEVAGQLFSRTLLGEPICFFRDSVGKVVALADRCAHRGAPLSKGRIEGDSVRCMYHGMKFASNGQCQEIPGQDRIPPQACVQSYPVIERDSWIWIWMGVPAKADAAQIPPTWSLGSPEWPYKPGYYRYAAPHMLICDNLLDFSHLGYVHPTTLGGTENIAQRRPTVTRGDAVVRVERWLTNEVPAPFHTKVASFSGLVDRWHFYDFHVPGLLVMHSGVQATGTGAPEGNIKNALEFRSCQAVTPESESSSHYFFAVPRNFAIADQSITDRLFQDVVDAFEEDKVMIEAQARNLERAGKWTMAAIVADAALSQFRWLMSQALQKDAMTEATARS
ncbi:aromatic ring-hydroxylating dioxygenase subunit alpha [Ottowia thiooxydans]|uniref:Phenylpropionate dioxygenase-like ring-hydroxylating dioxygenase large terminal subunit n=1 Tax=Ottowia thiooxydans TaxID=219182 RepID=A0ABV2Q4G9_9BURK